jgi:hypothetical protein
MSQKLNVRYSRNYDAWLSANHSCKTERMYSIIQKEGTSSSYL